MTRPAFCDTTTSREGKQELAVTTQTADGLNWEPYCHSTLTVVSAAILNLQRNATDNNYNNEVQRTQNYEL
jgi:hypothetical protein